MKHFKKANTGCVPGDEVVTIASCQLDSKIPRKPAVHSFQKTGRDEE